MKRSLLYTALLCLWATLLCIGESVADVTISKDRIHGAVDAYVRELLSDFPGEVNVSVRRRGALTLDGVGRVSLNVVPSTSRGTARSIPVLVEMMRGPAVIDTIPVLASVRYFDEVLVATRPIQRGERLDGSSVNAERREVTAHLDRYLTDPSTLAGSRAKMRIGFGRMIDPRYVEVIPTVKRGDRVRIEVNVSGIAATSEGIASEAGVVGDLIVVKNASSREKLIAKVVAPGLVRIAL